MDTVNNKLDTLIKEMAQKRENSYLYSMKEIDDIAEKIRDIVMGSNLKDPTPVVKIARFFGFTVFQSKNLDAKHYGSMHINDDVCKKINKESIIIVDGKDSLPQQRFIIAYTLGHYLYDYLGSKSSCIKQVYICSYVRNNHNDNSDRIANRFASSLLMPKAMFIKEHDDAVDIDNRKIYVIKYLSKLFQVEEASIIKRIEEVS